MKIIIILFFLSFLPQEHETKLLWDEDRKLTWQDFRGTPDRSIGFVASTNTGINFGYSYTLSNGEVSVEYSVESFFNPQKSWFIQGQISQHILNHEQTHFDISELHARMLRKRLDSKRFTKNVKSEIERIYLQMESQRKAMQKKFDQQTDHSRNVEKEIQWEDRVAKLLEAHEQWK